MVDNNSTDDSREFFANRFPTVRFIWKNENVGFAKANNQALQLAKGEKILFLNPDTILPEDGLEKCLLFFQQQNNLGALGVQMIDGAGNFLPESKRGFPSAFTSFCKMSGLTALFPQSKLFAKYYLGHLPENESHEVDVVSGAFMMIDKKILDAVGGFDEDYFMYAEDIDLSYRIQKAGYKNFYYAGTSIIHFKGESTSKQSAEYLDNFYGTMVLFVQKHYPKLSGHLYVLLLKILTGIKKLFAPKQQIEKQEALPGKAMVLTNDEAITAALQQYFVSVEEVEEISIHDKNAALVFCEPFISFAVSISIIQQMKNQCSFFIHAGHSQSMVGSSDKNTRGLSLPL